MAARSRKKRRALLDPGQRRDLWGLGLCGLAVLLALSLLPVVALGPAVERFFPAGNLVGPLGQSVAAASWSLLGVFAIFLPVPFLVWGLVAFGRVPEDVGVRISILLAGLVVLIPAGAHVLARPSGATPTAAGWLGGALGGPLAAAFGWSGAAVLLGLLLAAICVVSVGWNPVRTLAGGGGRAFRGLWTLGAALPGALRRPSKAPLPVADEAVSAEPAPLEPPRRPRGSGGTNGRGRGMRRAANDATLDMFAHDAGNPEAADLPNPGLLTAPPPRDEAGSQRELDALGGVLIDKLATFRIKGSVVGRTTGPVVTQFEVSPAAGVKVSRIASLEPDLALALRAPSVRIVAPIPGKGAVGVEVPNPEPEMVLFREVLEAAAFRGSRAQLPLALGKDISGRPYVADLARMPHLLIAGATGSGKSVCINTIITSLIYRHSPRSLRLLMVDPKMVELSMYNDLPHLRHPVVTDNEDAAGVLKWAVLEMERRYKLLSANGVRNLQDFNNKVGSGAEMRAVDRPAGEPGSGYGAPDDQPTPYEEGALPYVVLIIDELADLMMTVQGEVEKPLALLAQKARAIGIHLILATQRPSVNVITGLIKANFPSRIAFRVSSKIDSRTILDQNGADNLLGNGDMLLLPPGTSEPARIQGAFLSTEETERLMAWYREQAAEREKAVGAEPVASDEADILEVVRAREGQEDRGTADEALEDRDKLFREAAEVCIQQGGGSTSLLQRRLRIGYGRAARVIDQLHHAGVLGAQDGSKPREVLVDSLELDRICGE